MKIYLSGPMTGLPGLNAEAFDAHETTLRDLGHEVVNPAKLNEPGTPWQLCMRVDLAVMLGCEIVATLEGWDKSRGAQLEVSTARYVGIPIINVSELISAWQEAMA